jgi:hypothetical protein
MAHAALFILLSWSAWLSRMARRAGNAFALLSAAVLILFTGLRSDSTDYQEYVALFDLIDGARDTEFGVRVLLGKDPLFGVLLATLSDAGFGPQAMFMAATLFSVGLMAFAARRWPGGVAVALWVHLSLHFYLHDFTQIRVAIAVGCCLMALNALAERRTSAWLAWSLAGTGFHLSAALFPAATVLWLRQRPPSLLQTVLIALAIAAALRLSLAMLGEFEGRVALYEDTGSSVLPLALALVKCATLALLVKQAVGEAAANATTVRLLRASFLLAICGTTLLLGLRGASTGTAFRLYEFLDAFSVVLVTASIVARPVTTRLLALLYCALGLAYMVANGLVTPYAFL